MVRCLACFALVSTSSLVTRPRSSNATSGYDISFLTARSHFVPCQILAIPTFPVYDLSTNKMSESLFFSLPPLPQFYPSVRLYSRFRTLHLYWKAMIRNLTMLAFIIAFLLHQVTSSDFQCPASNNLIVQDDYGVQYVVSCGTGLPLWLLAQCTTGQVKVLITISRRRPWSLR